jgi:hypothetical protein
VNQYSFTDDNNELQEGTTVRYLLTEDMQPFAGDTHLGHKPAKATLHFDAIEMFKDIPVPALFEIVMGYNIDSQGKPSLKPLEFRFISGLSVTKADGSNKLSFKTKEP